MSLFKHSDKQPICDKHLTLMTLWDPGTKDPKELEEIKKITFKGKPKNPMKFIKAGRHVFQE